MKTTMGLDGVFEPVGWYAGGDRHVRREDVYYLRSSNRRRGAVVPRKLGGAFERWKTAVRLDVAACYADQRGGQGQRRECAVIAVLRGRGPDLPWSV